MSNHFQDLKTYDSPVRHCYLHSHHCHHIYSRCTNTFHCRKRIRKGKNKFVQLCLYLWDKVVAKSQKRNIIITYCSLLRHCCLRSHCCHYTGTPSAHVHYCHTRIHEDNQVAVQLPLYYRERDVKKFSLSYNIQKGLKKHTNGDITKAHIAIKLTNSLTRIKMYKVL